jgi:hypothetical protein
MISTILKHFDFHYQLFITFIVNSVQKGYGNAEKGKGEDNIGILEVIKIWACHKNNVNNQLLLTS